MRCTPIIEVFLYFGFFSIKDYWKYRRKLYFFFKLCTSEISETVNDQDTILCAFPLRCVYRVSFYQLSLPVIIESVQTNKVG